MRFIDPTSGADVDNRAHTSAPTCSGVCDLKITACSTSASLRSQRRAGRSSAACAHWNTPRPP
eukprot:2608591-Prymnesium_polylepis.1